ncbi:hypothetical protein JCM31826_03780 [Thermaurantimonas aggregans]|uniref:Uncharacterized protein n=1 Tax=Thermaurantimonas aggregans TaxID=2173829 RepID=A0A401XIR4_9FLAO|nr:hypothetical protein JCM31826_03780 [Thermaurantimonas aggregans]
MKNAGTLPKKSNASEIMEIIAIGKPRYKVSVTSGIAYRFAMKNHVGNFEK